MAITGKQKQKAGKAKKYKSSIGARVKHDISVLMAVSIGLIAIMTVILNFASTITSLQSEMETMAEITAQRVSEELQGTANIVTEMGMISKFSNNMYVPAQKQAVIDDRVKVYEMTRGKLIDADGICKFDGTDYSDRDYFKRSMKGEVVVSDPVRAKTDGKLSVIVSAPVWKDGAKDTTIAGVVFMVPDPDFLNNIAADVKVSKNGGCYMLNSAGTTIAHSTASIAEAEENTIEMAKTDSSLKSIAKLEEKMVDGETGCGFYLYGGQIKLLAYAPIADTNGWSVALTAPLTDFLASTIVCVLLSILGAAAAIAVGIRTAKIIGKVIGDPIKHCSERLVLLAEGDLHTPMPEITTEDETRKLADATESLMNSLKMVINDVDYLLGEMAEGNFRVSADKEKYYVGDFHGLIESMRTLKAKLSNALLDIRESVEQVSLGASQMAETAQGLAEGATDQAGSVEELQATITNLTSMVGESAQALKVSYEQARDFQKQAIASGEEMQDLTQAMQSINDTSKQINDIIEEIEDIASQTNLLSLNAAIEAARAGEAGRGFAVVADQIRKLADDSAKSAVHTRELIETSLAEIEKGNQITGRTYESLQKVVEGMDVLAGESQKAMDSSSTQAEAMEQLEQGIDQISIVVQNNSATAEETSATSEELSAQAINMNELVATFQLED